MELLKRYSTFAVAFVFAILASVSAFHYLSNHREGISIASSNPTYAVVVAGRDLPMGIKVTDEDLSIQQWPREIVTGDYYSHIKQLLGRTLRSNVIAGEPITHPKLLDEGDNLAALIPNHMRALSIQIGYSNTLARLLERGSVVDIIGTLGDGEFATDTKVIATAVRVLTVDKPQTGFGSDKLPHSMEVMLLVSPHDADSIVHARSRGTIELVVRNERGAKKS